MNIEDYNDIPDFGGFPDCPECGATMRYSYLESEFMCPECGKVMDQDDFDWDNENGDEMPQCCIGCSGAYPKCKTACKLFDD